MTKYGRKSHDFLHLIAEYHDNFPGNKQRTETVWRQVIEEGDRAFERSNMRGHITATMFILHPIEPKCLLIFHNHHQIWLPPGGHIEEDQLLKNALREAEEETGLKGITPIVPFPIHIDTHPITPRPAKNEGAHYHHDLLFLGQAKNTEIKIQEKEVSEADWRLVEDVAKGDDHSAHGARNAMTILERQRNAA